MRFVGAVLSTIMLLFAFGVQSGLVCPDRAHVSHQHHHHTDQHQTPVCCWALATCTSPAVPATQTAEMTLAPVSHHVRIASVDRPQSIAFAPETPPPRA